jgi:hypothetical protein
MLYKNCFAPTGELHGHPFLPELLWLACRCKCIRPRLFQAFFVQSIDSSIPGMLEVDNSYFAEPFPTLGPSPDGYMEPFNGVKFGVVIDGLCFYCHARGRHTVEWYKRSRTSGTIMRVKIDPTGYEFQFLPRGNRCSACGRVATETEKLGQCGAKCGTMYCDRQCQKLDWKRHKPLCEQLKTQKEASSGSTLAFEDVGVGTRIIGRF